MTLFEVRKLSLRQEPLGLITALWRWNRVLLGEMIRIKSCFNCSDPSLVINPDVQATTVPRGSLNNNTLISMRDYEVISVGKVKTMFSPLADLKVQSLAKTGN